MEGQGNGAEWVLAAFVAVPIFVLVAFNAISTVSTLADPCHTWGLESGGGLAPDEECPSRSATSTTRSDFVLTRIAIDGMLAFGAVAGLAAVARKAAALAAIGAATLVFVGSPLMLGMFGYGALLLGVVLVALAVGLRRRVGPGRPALAIGFASGAAVFAALVLWVVLYPDPHPALLVMFGISAALSLALIVWHWPRGPRSETPPAPTV